MTRTIVIGSTTTQSYSRSRRLWIHNNASLTRKLSCQRRLYLTPWNGKGIVSYASYGRSTSKQAAHHQFQNIINFFLSAFRWSRPHISYDMRKYIVSSLFAIVWERPKIRAIPSYVQVPCRHPEVLLPLFRTLNPGLSDLRCGQGDNRQREMYDVWPVEAGYARSAESQIRDIWRLSVWVRYIG
jgi:hypothetical protein